MPGEGNVIMPGVAESGRTGSLEKRAALSPSNGPTPWGAAMRKPPQGAAGVRTGRGIRLIATRANAATCAERARPAESRSSRIAYRSVSGYERPSSIGASTRMVPVASGGMRVSR